MNEKLRVYVAGHQGMVGGAICRRLAENCQVDLITRTKKDLDLTDQGAVRKFLRLNRIDQVYIAAAKVGGIHANATYPAEFLYQNLMIETNIIHSAFKSGVKKILFLGSSCIYPKFAEQPITEDCLLMGALEKTNEPYAIAKIAGLKMCESYNRQYGKSHGVDYRSIMPTNLYGRGDTYHEENSHVIPALIKRFHEAKEKRLESITIWGTGEARREFLYVDDLAEACLHVMNLSRSDYLLAVGEINCHINAGAGSEITIRELAEIIKEITGYAGELNTDITRPDGTPRKLLDSSKLQSLGWRPTTSLRSGLARTYEDFLSSIGSISPR